MVSTKSWEPYTVVCIQHATAVNRAFFRSVKGVHLLIHYDLFNGSRRHYVTAACRRQYFTATGRRTLVGSAEWQITIRLVRRAEGHITIRDEPFEIGSLYAVELCAPVVATTTSYSHGHPVVDVGFVALDDAAVHGDTMSAAEDY